MAEITRATKVVQLNKRDPHRTNVVGIVRVSDYDDVSPEDQLAALKLRCERENKNLIRVHRELDISGFTRSLAQRPGLLAAVEAVECHEADEILAAYFDRLFRSLKTQAEALERVEAAGGKIGSVDFGHISDETAVKWMTGTVVGMMAEYHSRSTRERTEPTRMRMVKNGELPWGTPPFGFVLDDERRIHIDEDLRDLIAQAWTMRAAGEPKGTIRRFLAEHGHERTIRSLDQMFKQPLYMGELHFSGEKTKRINKNPFGDVRPIVSRRTWDAVQTMHTPSGRIASSDRLLARLGVLHCAGCGSRMVVGGQVARWGDTTRRYAFYKCGRMAECPAPATIAAERIEEYVVEQTRAHLADAEERETAVPEAVEARRLADAATERHQRARRRLAVDEEASDEEARELLEELAAERIAAVGLAERLADECEEAESVNAASRWDDLSVSAQRSLIRFAIERADVSRGRASVKERVVITLRTRESLLEQSTRLTT